MAKKPAGVKYDAETKKWAEEMYGEYAGKVGKDVMEVFRERAARHAYDSPSTRGTAPDKE